MNSDIIIELPKYYDQDILDAVWELVKLCNNEFIPPLSDRNSTVQTDLSKSIKSNSDQPLAYFEKLKTQQILIAKYSNKICGFLSFQNKFTSKKLKSFSPSNYVTTVCIDKKYRGKGICSLLYKELIFNLPKNLRCDFVTTRTWEGNTSHIKILNNLGFEIVSRIENDRGKGIHTLYWGKKITK